MGAFFDGLGDETELGEDEEPKQLDGVNAEQFVKTIAEWNAAVRKDVPFNPNVHDGLRTSGLKINSGADGPAALVISEKQRAQIAGDALRDRAVKNRYDVRTNERTDRANVRRGVRSG